MQSHNLSRGKLMADYYDFEASGLRIKASPAGWRGFIPLAKKFPFVTGSWSGFRIVIDATEASEDLEGMSFRYRFQPGTGVDTWEPVPHGKKIIMDIRACCTNTPWAVACA